MLLKTTQGGVDDQVIVVCFLLSATLLAVYTLYLRWFVNHIVRSALCVLCTSEMCDDTNFACDGQLILVTRICTEQECSLLFVSFCVKSLGCHICLASGKQMSKNAKKTQMRAQKSSTLQPSYTECMIDSPTIPCRCKCRGFTKACASVLGLPSSS